MSVVSAILLRTNVHSVVLNSGRSGRLLHLSLFLVPFTCEVSITYPFALVSGKSQYHTVAIVVDTYERVVAEDIADVLRFGIRNE